MSNVVVLCCDVFWQAGKLEIYDISSGQLLESVDAHEGPVWSVSLASDKVRTMLAFERAISHNCSFLVSYTCLLSGENPRKLVNICIIVCYAIETRI